MPEFKPYPKIKSTKFFNNTKNKYGNNTSVYNGRTYDSIKEANYAKELDWRKKAGEILAITPQYKLEIFVVGKRICNYYVDFRILLPGGKVEYHEVKGFETDLWKLKWKLACAIYGEQMFVLIK